MAQEGSRPEHESTLPSGDDDAYLKAVAQAVSSASALAPEERTIVDGIRESIPEAGQVLAGKYRVERVLGAGGMGVVVAARHLQLDAPVAMKFMTQETAAEGHLVARFLREARATARLRGEHVVRVSDIGELDSGAPFMVMEFLEGQDLSALLDSLGPPPVTSAVEYAIQACEGLDEAHRAGIVHRDVKPANLFLTRRPNGTACIKVVDFGISKAVTMVDPSHALHSTNTRAVFGSPMYMAPEQMRAARDVDLRADIWSLGATLYELLTGVVPFAAESLLDLAYRIANEPPAPLRVRRPEVPYELEQVVLRCLEKNPRHRFANVREVAAALEPFRGPRRARVALDDEEPTRFIDGPNVLREAGAGADDVLRASVPSIDTTSLTAIEEAPSVPLSRSTSSESLKESRVSWGNSQRPMRPVSRGLVVWAAVAGTLFVAVTLGIASLFAGREAPAASPTPVVGAKVSAAAAVPSHAAAIAPVLSSVPVEALPLTEPTAEVRTVSVMDLPTAAPPVPPVAAIAPAPSIATAISSTSVTPVAVPGMTPSVAARLGIPKAIAAFGSASPAPRDPPNCSPPYFYDELGLKVFKPECVN